MQQYWHHHLRLVYLPNCLEIFQIRERNFDDTEVAVRPIAIPAAPEVVIAV